MVRLKVTVFDPFAGSAATFQFLMVRLKEIAELTPYNAIVISIPYGAIKSIIEDKISSKYEEFQFLMVRLKG